jgi:ABC-type uncharacterized transport system permease subunit
MPESPPAPSDAARSRIRSIVTTLLLVMIALMIVRDIFVRRWSTPAPPVTDVTQRSR